MQTIFQMPKLIARLFASKLEERAYARLSTRERSANVFDLLLDGKVLVTFENLIPQQTLVTTSIDPAFDEFLTQSRVSAQEHLQDPDVTRARYNNSSEVPPADKPAYLYKDPAGQNLHELLDAALQQGRKWELSFDEDRLFEKFDLQSPFNAHGTFLNEIVLIEWRDHDTDVGLCAVAIDEHHVGFSFQRSRHASKEYFWANPEAEKSVFEKLLSYIKFETKGPYISLSDFVYNLPPGAHK